MSWSKQQQSRLIKATEKSAFADFKPQLGKLIAAAHKDPHKIDFLVEVLKKLIFLEKFDKVIDVVGEVDQQTNWKNADQQLALAENIQSILNLFHDVKLDENAKESAFLECVRLLGSAMAGNSNVKRIITKKVSLLKYLIEKLAELRHGDSQVDVLKQIFRLTPQVLDQKQRFCAEIGLDRSFEILVAQDFNNTARKFLRGFNYARNLKYVSFVELNMVQGSLGQNNFKSISPGPVQCDLNDDSLYIPIISKNASLEALDLQYSEMMEWRHLVKENCSDVFIVEIRMKQSWVKENKFLSIRFEIADMEFVEVESLFEAKKVNIWHGAVVRKPLAVQVKKPILDESNVNERHKNEHWQKEASQDLSMSMNEDFNMEEGEDDKENLPPAAATSGKKKYKIKTLPENSANSSSPLMVPAAFDMPDSPHSPSIIELNPGLDFKRSISIDSLPEPGQKVVLSAESVAATYENNATTSTVEPQVPIYLKPKALGKGKKQREVQSKDLSSGGILANFAEGLNSPKKGKSTNHKALKSTNITSDARKCVTKIDTDARAKQSSETLPSKYESNDDSYVEESETQKLSRPSMKKKSERGKLKKGFLPKQQNKVIDTVSDDELVSSQEKRFNSKKSFQKGVHSDIEKQTPKIKIPERYTGRKTLKPWLNEEASDAFKKNTGKSIGSLDNRRTPTSPLVPKDAESYGKSSIAKASDFSRNLKKRKAISPLRSALPKRPIMKHSLSLIEDSPVKIQRTHLGIISHGSPLKLNLSLSANSLDSNNPESKPLSDENPLSKISRKVGQVIYILKIALSISREEYFGPSDIALTPKEASGTPK